MENRDVAFQLLPLTFNGLVVENTNRCNAKCSMCYQFSGPQGSDIWGKQNLSNTIIKKAIEDARKIESLRGRFHLAGGESFLHPDDCFELFAFAKSCQYESITTTTNCYWANKPKKAESFAKKMKKSGVTQIEISWDIWHLPYIKAEAVNNAIFACTNQNIYVNLRILTTKSHSIEEALLLLSSEAIDLVDEISSGPVFNTGRAAIELEENDFFTEGNVGGNCHSVLQLTVNSKGQVYPCCAGADQTDSLSFGNIHNESIVDIYHKMNESRLLRTLVFHGIGSFIPILEDNGVTLNKTYGNICQLCWDIFSNSEYSKIIKDHYSNLSQVHRQALLEVLRVQPTQNKQCIP